MKYNAWQGSILSVSWWMDGEPLGVFFPVASFVQTCQAAGWVLHLLIASLVSPLVK